MLTGSTAQISQGQRQLISIARAAVADPPVMILDEATSSIDTRTEALVQHGMDKLMHGRTVFVIAHRLSTVRNSDVIMVLEHGRIIERGNHEKLIGARKVLSALYRRAGTRIRRLPKNTAARTYRNTGRIFECLVQFLIPAAPIAAS